MDGYPSLHVSLSNPEGPASTDLPLLLHRVADTIEELGLTHDEILDLVISGDEITEYGSWWNATLYWSPRDPDGPTWTSTLLKS
ncbi:hypothetical protein [Nocardioides daeguensis]|uniref:hypothetical protein n=1 Tax=Nocardioides daeguensis TaxID=908359 RepID=UPI001C448989|nr:hypothetical protein [Nocardioides daeguensis]MBV6726567.1 hypothetical protein [Nocardioides daeguensis]MCR1772410.1 hypothetical protein [Nocardioides daeguensis]